MAAAAETSSNPPRPDLHSRQRRLVFDRRYGWIFSDECTDPAVSALSGGRGMFCILPMAQALMNAAASSVDYAADSVSRVLKRPEIISPVPRLHFQRKRRTWFHELEQSGVIADANLVPCRTVCAFK